MAPRAPRKAPQGRGQPPVEIDIAAVERAASIGCTMEEIAAIAGVSRSTLFNRADSDEQFKDAITRGRDTGKATLRRLQWKAASEGNPTLLIWLGKQMLGQSDKIDNSVILKRNPQEMTDDELAAIAAGGSTGATDQA